MYRQHFGLKHAPFGKDCIALWDHDQFKKLDQQFAWLLRSPGLGLLTAESGLGKTAALRRLTRDLSPHQYQVHYIAETDFGRLDFYRQLAITLNVPSSYRRAQLWRDIKDHVTHLATQKNILLSVRIALEDAKGQPALHRLILKPAKHMPLISR